MRRYSAKRSLFLFSISFIALLLSFITTSAHALDMRASFYIQHCHAEISTSSRGDLDIDFVVNAMGRMDEIGVTTIHLYEDAGDGFKLVKTFRHTDREYSYMLGEDASHYVESVPYEGTSGYDYYAEVDFYAADEYGEDSFSLETDIATAR